MTDRPYPTIATGTENGGTDPAALGGSGARRTVYAERAAGRWESSGDADNDGGVLRLSSGEAATIQTYPRGWGFTERPAMTVHGHGLLTRGPSGQKEAIVAGLEAGTFLPRPPYSLESARKPGEQRDDYVSLSDRYEPDAVNFTVEEAAILQTFPAWAFERPATTVVADPRLGGPGRSEYVKGGVSRQNRPGSMKLTEAQAAALQSYPAPFPFQGGRGKQFLQIGNAVPPLLAHAIISELVRPAAAAIVPTLAPVELSTEMSLWDQVFDGIAA
ncbi:DNA cytosine methyltransferase [Microbacterium allomyrinae]|uniref:DNA cytosine methyltransferase n=1 Tax=Microbacterium allomyrinae TaxID=2830666 RepID=A0A9X1LRI5_9MICO|nr:DNA cytosine methyltransferase [Microbacterium allomyrinae]MCC2030639.1 DNA cytosine methyltransferase [Microbacterium allomyrinae]